MNCECHPMAQRDCALIMDAVRRLRDVLWNLEEEDLDITCHLFPQIRSALMDHITFEERLVFPELSLREREGHKRAHAELTSVLWALEQALAERLAERCRSLLDVLSVLLEEHHRAALAPTPRDPSTEKVKGYVFRVLKRSQQLTLECP